MWHFYERNITAGALRKALYVALLSSLLILAGCAASRGKGTAAKITAPPSWSSVDQSTATSSAGDLSKWWNRLGDSTLSELVEDALKANPDVRSAQARLRQARAERNLAGANRFPTVTASATGSGTKSSGGNDATGSFNAGFDATWEPDVFGGKRLALEAAKADVRASEEDLHNTQVSLAAEVALNYVEFRSTQARLDIAKRNATAQGETFQLTQWREQAGLVGSVDVEQARTNLEQTNAGIPTLESTLAQIQHRLGVLLGRDPAALNQRLSASAPVPSAPDSVSIGIPAETLRQRPDVRAAEQRVVAETARLGQANTTRYPHFSLTGSIGTEVVSGVVTGGTSAISSIVGSVLQTIFDGGRIRQQIEIQSAVQEQAVVSYEATVLTALEDVENALVSYEKSRARIAALTSAAEAARNAELLARNRYSAGLSDFQTVLDTQRTVLSVEDSLASTQAERTTAVIQLYKALGGGWSTENSTSTKQGI